jgi:hypothetical protein
LKAVEKEKVLTTKRVFDRFRGWVTLSAVGDSESGWLLKAVEAVEKNQRQKRVGHS